MHSGGCCFTGAEKDLGGVQSGAHVAEDDQLSDWGDCKMQGGK
jgi:hypothetical protein